MNCSRALVITGRLVRFRTQWPQPLGAVSAWSALPGAPARSAPPQLGTTATRAASAASCSERRAKGWSICIGFSGPRARRGGSGHRKPRASAAREEKAVRGGVEAALQVWSGRYKREARSSQKTHHEEHEEHEE